MKGLDLAIRIAVEAHAGQVDKGGMPYILHPLYVMEQVRYLGETAMIGAVLHDVYEDSDRDIKEVEEHFGARIYSLVLSLTNIFDDYNMYIDQVAMDPLATEIKLIDLRHNSDIMRMKGLRQKDFDRLEKYHKAYAYLRDL